MGVFYFKLLLLHAFAGLRNHNSLFHFFSFSTKLKCCTYSVLLIRCTTMYLYLDTLWALLLLITAGGFWWKPPFKNDLSSKLGSFSKVSSKLIEEPSHDRNLFIIVTWLRHCIHYHQIIDEILPREKSYFWNSMYSVEWLLDMINLQYLCKYWANIFCNCNWMGKASCFGHFDFSIKLW